MGISSEEVGFILLVIIVISVISVLTLLVIFNQQKTISLQTDNIQMLIKYCK